MGDPQVVDFDLDVTSDGALTLAEPVSGEGRYVRNDQGSPRFGHIRLTLAPYLAGPRRYRSEWRVPEGFLPLTFMPTASLDGVKVALGESFLGGVPVAFLCAAVTDGSYHDTDTDEAAVAIAASMAVKDALRRGRLVRPWSGRTKG